MFTTFRNVSFIADSVTGLEVEGKVLYVITPSKIYEVGYDTATEAKAGLSELTDILNAGSTGTKTTQEAPRASKSEELKTAITTRIERLQDVLDSVKTTATDKVQEAVLAKVFGGAGKTVSDLMDSKDNLVARAADMLSSLEKLLDKEEVKEEPKPMATRNEPKVQIKDTKEVIARAASILDTDGIFSTSTFNADVQVTAARDPKKITADEFKQIFGTPAEPLVGDMSERQLRSFIAEFVDGALANERVQQLFQNIKDNFGVDEAEGAIDGYKNLILTIALQNTEMTLSEIISQYFS